MKAVLIERFGGPEVMEYREVSTPQPQAGEVLVAVHAVTVNRTLDIHVRRDGDGRSPVLPLVLGVDPTGEIVAVGEGVARERIGERVAIHSPVYCGRCSACRGVPSPDCVKPLHVGIHRWGGYADYVVAPSANAIPIPAGLDYAEASVIFRHFPTAFHLLDCKAGLRAGETVLVMGAAGGLGNALIQVARERGARVVGAAGSDEGVALARALGADLAVHYRRDDLVARVRAFSDDRGADVVCENIGDPQLWNAAFESLAGGGRLVTVGAHAGGDVKLDVKKLYRRKLTLIGGAGSDEKDVRATYDGAAAGRFRAAIDRVLPLSQVAEAHRLVDERVVTGKVVLVPDAVLAPA
jgi:NADPH:quinone reductase-like Zn-dependent oxidoreductase